MLELRGINRNFYWTPVVKGFNFFIQRGEIVGILGADGSGKTTTAKIIAGMLIPNSGSVYLDGDEMNTRGAEYKRRVGYVPQKSEVCFHLSGVEYLVLIGRLGGIAEGTLERQIDDLLKLLNLGVERLLPMSSFSREISQKIMLAAALLHDPEILVLDESFSHFDAVAIESFQEILQRLAGMGKMIIYCSNRVSEVESFCSRVVFMEQGQVMAEETTDRLALIKNLPVMESFFRRMVPYLDRVNISGLPALGMRAG